MGDLNNLCLHSEVYEPGYNKIWPEDDAARLLVRPRGCGRAERIFWLRGARFTACEPASVLLPVE